MLDSGNGILTFNCELGRLWEDKVIKEILGDQGLKVQGLEIKKTCHLQ